MDEETKQEIERIWKKVTEIETLIGNKPKIPQNCNTKYSEIENFCKNIEISEEELRNKIDFQDMPRLTFAFKEKSRTKIQFKSLMVLALLCKKIYSKSLTEGEILKLFKFSKVPSERMDKLYSSTSFKKYFSKTKDQVNCSWAGEKESEKIIKNLIKNE